MNKESVDEGRKRKVEKTKKEVEGKNR